jgi:hypothetical protein
MTVTKADREREFAVCDLLGPLARHVLDEAPRCISAQNVVRKFIIQNSKKWDTVGPRPLGCSASDLVHPDVDRALAEYIKQGYRDMTGKAFEPMPPPRRKLRALSR